MPAGRRQRHLTLKTWNKSLPHKGGALARYAARISCCRPRTFGTGDSCRIRCSYSRGALGAVPWPASLGRRHPMVHRDTYASVGIRSGSRDTANCVQKSSAATARSPRCGRTEPAAVHMRCAGWCNAEPSGAASPAEPAGRPHLLGQLHRSRPFASADFKRG